MQYIQLVGSILICNSHGFPKYTVIFSTAFSETLVPPKLRLVARIGSKPQLACIVVAFTDALTTCWFPVKVSYSVLFTKPEVDNTDELRLDMDGASGVILAHVSAERLTEGSGQVEFDAMTVVSVTLYGWNCMIVGDATCRTEMHVKYKNTKITARGDAAILVCCHNVRTAAPSPAHASDMS